MNKKYGEIEGTDIELHRGVEEVTWYTSEEEKLTADINIHLIDEIVQFNPLIRREKNKNKCQ